MGGDDGKPKSTEKKVSCLRIMINFKFFIVWSFLLSVARQAVIYSRLCEAIAHCYPRRRHI